MSAFLSSLALSFLHRCGFFINVCPSCSHMDLWSFFYNCKGLSDPKASFERTDNVLRTDDAAKQLVDARTQRSTVLRVSTLSAEVKVNRIFVRFSGLLLCHVSTSPLSCIPHKALLCGRALKTACRKVFRLIPCSRQLSTDPNTVRKNIGDRPLKVLVRKL